MNVSLFIAALCGITLICLWIGRWAGKASSDNETYFLGKRSLTIFPLALTLLATQLGGGALTGASDEAYAKGWIVLLYPLGMSLGLLVLGVGFGKRLREKNLTTMAELFEKAYGSIKLRKVVSILSIVTLFLVLVGQGVAIRKFFAAIGMDQPIFLIAIWAAVTIYTVMGGFKAVVFTDVMQSLFIMGIFVYAFFSINIPTNAMEVPAQKVGEVPWLSWLLMPLLFMVIEQDMGQRCFAAKKGKFIAISASVAALLLFAMSFLAVYLGVLAKSTGIEIPPNVGVLMSAAIAFTGPNVVALFGVAYLMVILSTADSLLCSVSSNLVCDFSLKRSKLVTAGIGISAILCAFCFEKVLPILIGAYELSVCTLFVPTVLAVFCVKASKKGAIASMTMGFCCFILFKFWQTSFPKELLTLGLSTAAALSFQLRERAAA